MIKNFKDFFRTAVPTEVTISDVDLRRLSGMVYDIQFLRASNGNNYCYFFPCHPNNNEEILQLLDKYKISGQNHVTHYCFVDQNIVRVKYKTPQEMSVLQKCVDKIILYGNGRFLGQSR